MTTYILALSYQDTDKEKYTASLASLHDNLKGQNNPIDAWLLSRISPLIASKSIEQDKDITLANLFIKEDGQACSNMLNMINRGQHPIYTAQEIINHEQENCNNNVQHPQYHPIQNSFGG